MRKDGSAPKILTGYHRYMAEQKVLMGERLATVTKEQQKELTRKWQGDWKVLDSVKKQVNISIFFSPFFLSFFHDIYIYIYIYNMFTGVSGCL